MVTPLTRTDKNNQPLRRPPRVEAEISEALTWDMEKILSRASLPETHEEGMGSECMVHLIRQDLDTPGNPLVELLLPILLERCSANLRFTVKGFREPTLGNVREEILSRLGMLLIDRTNSADFFEVRFSLAMARLRIDCCHKYKRSEDHLVYGDDDTQEMVSEAGDHDAHSLPTLGKTPLDPEQSYCLKQALSRLEPQERQILLLHRIGGVAIAGGTQNLVTMMGLSERTIRNRLRSAEQTLAAYKGA